MRLPSCEDHICCSQQNSVSHCLFIKRQLLKGNPLRFMGGDKKCLPAGKGARSIEFPYQLHLQVIILFLFRINGKMVLFQYVFAMIYCGSWVWWTQIRCQQVRCYLEYVLLHFAIFHCIERNSKGEWKFKGMNYLVMQKQAKTCQ